MSECRCTQSMQGCPVHDRRPMRMWAKTEKGTLFHASVDPNISDESMRAIETIVDAAYDELEKLESESSEPGTEN